MIFVKPDIYSFKNEEQEEIPVDWEGYLVVYEKPYKDGQWTIGVDVVEGVEGGDYANITVYDRFNKSVAAVYWSRIDEVGLAKVVKLVQEYFTPDSENHEPSWVGIETNGPGLATFDIAVELGVDNLFLAPRYDVVNGGVTYKKGWRTDTNSRNELIAGIKAWLIDRAGAMNSHRLCGECMTFVRSKTGKPLAKAGCHDDMVFGLGICIQVDEIVPLDEKVEKPKKLTYSDIVGPKAIWEEVPELAPQDRCFEQAVIHQSIFQNRDFDDMLDG